MARMLETEKHRDPTGPDCTRDGAVKKATRGRTRHPGAHSGIRGSKAPLGSSFSRQPPEKMSEFLLSSLVLPIPLTNTRARLWFSLPKHRGIKGFLLRDRRPGEVSALEQWRWQVPRTDGARTALRDTQTRRKGFGGEGFRSRVGRETGRGQELQRRAVGTGGLQVSLKTTFSGESWRGLRSPVQGPSEKQPRRGWGGPAREAQTGARTDSPSELSRLFHLPAWAPRSHQVTQGLRTKRSQEGITVLAEETQTRRAGPPAGRCWGPFPPRPQLQRSVGAREL